MVSINFNLVNFSQTWDVLHANLYDTFILNM